MARHYEWPFPKDTVEVKDYDVDWSDDLVGGEVISNSTWLAPSGITVDSDDHSDTATKIWLSGGHTDGRYVFRNIIVTDGGRTMKRSITLLVRTR